MKTYVAFDLALAERERIEAVAPGEVVYGPDEGELPAELEGAEVVFGNIAPAWLEALPALKWLQLGSVGFGEYCEVLAGPVGDRLKATNLAGFFDDPVAESILAGLLALLRGIDRAVVLKGQAAWEGDGMRPSLALLKGARVVIFGHGAIGRRLAALLAPFGCRIDTFGSGWEADALDSALGEADIVAAIAPHTPATAGAFDAARLSRLKAGALLANFGRGSLIDETALAQALASGRLGGAVLDVTREEPLSPQNPLWQAPRLILTQHTGGGTGDERARKVGVFIDNLTRYKSGEPLVGLVDIVKGY